MNSLTKATVNWRAGEEKCVIKGCANHRYNRLYMCYHHYYRDYKYNNPLEPSHNRGIRVEVVIATALKSFGREVKTFNAHHPFDLLVDGLRIEIKSSSRRFGNSYNETAPFWKFVIGQIKQGEPSDYYVFSLTDASQEYSYLLLKSPIGKTAFTVSERQLKSGRYDQAVKDFKLLCRGELAVAA